MTNQEAMQEARRRWGRTGNVQKRGKQHRVGHVDLGMFFAVEGTGATWSAAFDNADQRRVGKPATA